MFAIKNMLYKQSYNSQRKTNVKRSRVKSPTKANAYLHNGDFKLIIIIIIINKISTSKPQLILKKFYMKEIKSDWFVISEDAEF